MYEYYHMIGYAGSFLIAISLSMKNIRRLRQINLFGASTFATYGLLIGSYPVLALNSYIAAIDLFFLFKMYATKEQFSMIPVLDSSHLYLSKFIEFYQEDIRKFFPEFDKSKLPEFNCFFILRDLRPVGLFIFKQVSESEIKIELDYAIPEYRDLKNGKYVYSVEAKYLREKGYKVLSMHSSVEKHQKYLLNVGFKRDKNKPEIFLNKLGE